MLQTQSKVRVQGRLSNAFNIRQGLKQGDALSCTLFILALEGVMRKLPASRGGTIFNRTTQNLAFADDIAMLATNTRFLEENLQLLGKEAARLGLLINKDKTKYMITSRKNTRWRNITQFEGYERVTHFKYLGEVMTERNEVQMEIKGRLAAGNRCYFSFQKLLRSSLVTRHLKLLVYKTIIKPVVMYGSETWTLTKRDEDRLCTWERKVLRKIYGAVNTNGQWRIRTNAELAQLYDSPNILADIKARRIRWLGHVHRMNEHRVPKKVLQAKPMGNRSVGRPRLRWLDDVEADLRKIGVRNWKRLAESREEWRTQAVGKALALNGL